MASDSLLIGRGTAPETHVHESPAALTIVERATNQSIAHGTDTLLTWETEVLDELNAFDLADPSKLTTPTPGVYLLLLQVRWAPATTARADVYIAVEGALKARDYHFASSSGDTFSMSCEVVLRLAAGVVAQGRVAQASGAALNVLVFGDTRFSMTRLGD
jgi:hypothetical protein